MSRTLNAAISLFAALSVVLLGLGIATSYNIAFADEPLGPGCQTGCCCSSSQSTCNATGQHAEPPLLCVDLFYICQYDASDCWNVCGCKTFSNGDCGCTVHGT